MPASALTLASLPASITVITLALRYGPSAVLTLIAGVVAVLVPGRRGDRALAVLRLVRATSNSTRKTHHATPTRRV